MCGQSWPASSDPSSTGSCKSKTLLPRGQPGAERSLCGALYTVFLCSSTLLWLFVRLWNCERRTQHLIDLRAAELSHGCSSNAEAAVLLDTPRIRYGDGPIGAAINHQLGDVHCT